jgi:RNA polymerase sigma factor (sigma-70 family)
VNTLFQQSRLPVSVLSERGVLLVNLLQLNFCALDDVTDHEALDALALRLQAIERQVRDGGKTMPQAWDFIARRTAQRKQDTLLVQRRTVLGLLYREVNPRLERYLIMQGWKFTGTQTAEDLRNDMWQLLLDKIENFDPQRGKFTTWFFAFVVSQVLNRERRAKMRQSEKQQPDVELDTLTAPSTQNVLAGFPPECQAVIHNTLNGMSPRLRAIMVGLYYEVPPKKQKELALDLGITPAAVNQNKNKALAQLREALTIQGCDP